MDVVNLYVKNKRTKRALGAKAIIRFLSTPPEAKILENERELHWAATDYLVSTTNEHTIDIGQTPQRLDVFFSHKGQNKAGCWSGTSCALRDIPVMDQYYMPPGRYEFNINVVCENGKGHKKRYIFQSPNLGDTLSKPEEINNWLRKLGWLKPAAT